MQIKKVRYLFFVWLFVWGCDRNADPDIGKALEIAGGNRPALQQVIDHFSVYPQDSLKLKAALFLIAHLPGHYSNIHPAYKEYLRQLDSLYPEMPDPLWKAMSYVRLKDRSVGETDREEDATVLQADFLIRHIDVSFRKWLECPWLENLGFNEFCEYLLPYRFYEEPLGQETDTILWKAMTAAFRYYPALPITTENAWQMVRLIVKGGDDIYRPRLKLPYSGTYEWDCFDNCFYEVNRMREAGIAATIDYIPAWPTRNGTHCWKVVFDDRYRDDSWRDAEDPLAAKIYRRTYSHQPIPSPAGRDFVPVFFRIPFYQDVTSQYIKTLDLVITPDIKGEKVPEYVYLTVFNDQEWKPVAWAPFQKGKTCFKEVGYGFVYLPVYYQGQRRVNATYPLLIDRTKNIRELRPDSIHRVDLHLTRKFPLAFNKLQWGKDLIDCFLEASNDPQLSEWEVVGRIAQADSNLNYLSIPLSIKKPYRYWRIRKTDRILNIGELEFFDSGGIKTTGTIISARSNPQDRLAFDGDVLTYCRAWSWIGMDLEKPKSLAEVRIISRTDDNGICPGHEYELFYYGENGWMSMGRQIPTGPWLDYKEVPGGALYWLHDRSGGKEERIFVWKNGHIVWM